MKIKTTTSSILVTGATNLDAKSSIGSGRLFSSIEDFLDRCPTTAIANGMLIQDTNYSVTWQIYNTGSGWAAKIYDGKFSVKSVALTYITDPLSGTKTISGVSCVEDDIVLLTAQATPHMNGVWIVKSSTWERHPIFASSTNGINFPGVTFVVTEGTYKNSQWKLTTVGELVMSDSVAEFYSSSLLDFECIDPSKNSIPLNISLSNSIGRFNKNTYVDATASDITVSFSASTFFNEDYLIKKTDTSSNKVIVVNPSQQPVFILSNSQDWVKLSNNIDPSLNILSDLGDYEFQYYSNTACVTFVNEDVVYDSQLSNSIPANYSLYSITLSADSDIAVVSLGTTSDATDITDAVGIGVTPVTVIVDSSDVTDVYIASADWGGLTVSSSMLTYKS